MVVTGKPLISFTGEPIDPDTFAYIQEIFGVTQCSMYGTTKVGVLIVNFPGLQGCLPTELQRRESRLQRIRDAKRALEARARDEAAAARRFRRPSEQEPLRRGEASGPGTPLESGASVLRGTH